MSALLPAGRHNQGYPADRVNQRRQTIPAKEVRSVLDLLSAASQRCKEESINTMHDDRTAGKFIGMHLAFYGACLNINALLEGPK